ncbi:MAG: polysaccharide biosynthesis tyrosine autokinase [Chloroflexi bacterium]|nr:polysaccharide biosynthesis tyrosine autokinase [Chloroflexota bacterium]
MEIQRYWAIVRKWLWLIVLGTLVAGGVSYVLSHRMEPVYRATATIVVHESTTSAISSFDYSQSAVYAHAQLIKKESVMEQVITELNLPYSPAKLRAKIGTHTATSSPLIGVSADDTDPLMAQKIADATVAVYMEQNRESLQAEAEASLSQIQGEIDDTSASIDVLQEKKSTTGLTSKEADDLATLQDDLDNLKNLRTLYTSQLAQALAAGGISIGESASLPTSPISPKTMQNVILAYILGLVVTTGGAFLKEYLDRSIKTAEDISTATGLSTLGAIPKFKANPGQNGGLITEAHPRSSVAEAFRILRTSLQFVTVDKPAQTFLVIAAGPQEGKSSVLANLAVSLAQTGKKVIAVDTDLRRPTLHDLFQMPNTIGFSNLLIADQPDLDGFLRPTKVEGLRIITAGPTPPNPADLLGSTRMSFLIEELKKKADIVLFDSAPVLAVADATIVAPKVDGVILVVSSGDTRPEALAEVKNRLSNGDARILGVVLNQVKRQGGGYYYHYRYAYYYGDDEEGHETRHQRHGISRGWKEQAAPAGTARLRERRPGRR